MAFNLEFLDYSKRWKESTEYGAGNFTHNARSRMFLAWQTSRDFRSLCIQLFSQQNSCFKKAWNLFLLSDLAKTHLQPRSQALGTRLDQLEEYFGSQRKLGRRNDNPEIKTFGYNNNTLRNSSAFKQWCIWPICSEDGTKFLVSKQWCVWFEWIYLVLYSW